MLYVAIVPSWIWVIVLGALWTALWRCTLGVPGPGRALLLGVFGVLTLQTLLAAATAIATHVHAIGYFACRSGGYGALATPTILVIEIGVLLYYFRFCARGDEPDRISAGPWLRLWSVLALVVWLVHARSAVLCTV